MAKIDGNLIYIEWDGANVVGLTDKSIDFDTDMIPTTNQQSTGNWKTVIPGESGATFNCSGIYDEAESEGATSLWADLVAGTSVAFKFGQDVATGGAYWSGNGIVTKLTVNGPKNAASSYTATVLMTGKPTQSLTGGF